MIEFPKQNEFVAYITRNGLRIGTLEKHHDGYMLEIWYRKEFINNKQWSTTDVKKHCEKVYKDHLYDMHSRFMLEGRGKTIQN